MLPHPTNCLNICIVCIMLNFVLIVSCILTTWDLNKNLLPHRFSRWISCQIHYSNQQCYQFGLMKWYRLFHHRNCQCRCHTQAPCQCSKRWYPRLSIPIDTCNRHQSSLVRSPKKLLEMMKPHANIIHKLLFQSVWYHFNHKNVYNTTFV